ncbi:transposase [Candidatus Absconditicoccus praedator]|nr:transposase [Candidatus Absconditicoccus praedator]UFX82523.1 transposase [Candidatus Absconditicoccus praedator]
MLECDEIVKLYGKGGDILEKELRLIKAINQKNEVFLFITNMYNFTAEEITEFYARRWDIEVFFRFIKQEFGFSHFVSRSKNGIMNMLYMTLITSILVIVYKSKNSIKSYKEAKRRFIAELDELILIELAIAIGGDVDLLKKKYLNYYKYS